MLRKKVWLVCLGILLWTGAASAEKRQFRDYFLEPSRKGLWAHADVLTIGVQATLESRTPIEDETFGMLSVRGSALVSTGFSESAAHVDARYTLLSVGASMGYRHVFRTYQAPAGQEVTSDGRRDADSRGSFTAQGWGWGETRARLLIPLDSFSLVTNHAIRFEDSPANAYDWFHTNVHDGGFMYRGDAVLFARSKKLGALGPLVRYMDLPRGGSRVGELSAGFLYVVRPGLKSRDDILSLAVLVRPGDDEFGFHILRMPVFAMLVYRASFQLLE